MNEETRTLLTAPLPRLMIRYGLPCILSLLAAALYNIVDQIFIANAPDLGSAGNAANTAVFPLTIIALAIATMIGDGAGAMMSIRLGEGNREKASATAMTAVVLSLIAGISLMILYLGFADPILTVFGANVNTRTLACAREYFFWITLGIPFYVFSQMMNPLIRSDGSPTLAMTVLVTGALVNCILDPVMIFLLHMGMAGAAIATILGQLTAAVLSLWYMTRWKSISNVRPDFACTAQILTCGLTSFFSQISIVISMMAVLQMTLQTSALDPVFSRPDMAQIPMAVIGIVMKFFQIAMSAAIGLAAGCIPVTSCNLGAGNRSRLLDLMKYMLVTEAVTGLIFSLFFILCPDLITTVFGGQTEGREYMAFSRTCIRCFLLLLPLSCMNKATFIFLQSLGFGLLSAGLSILREIVLGAGLPVLFGMIGGLYGMLWFMAGADLITAAVQIPVWIWTIRKLKSGLLPLADAGKALAGA